jgi:CTP:molybdopterin cytidylyltransferase MocA
MAVMPGPLVVIFHQPPRKGEPPLTGLLAAARHRLVEHHARLFSRAGARRVAVVSGHEGPRTPDESFGRRLAVVVARERPRHGVVVLGSGAVPLLRRGDAARLIEAAGRDGRHALTNNLFSSDVCAVSAAWALADLPSLPTDNVLPRWLEEVAGYRVRELRGRERLAIDLDTPLDLALLGLASPVPAEIRAMARDIQVPRREALRELAADPHRELLVMGRSSARTLHWLERHVRCRVRFLAEERGLKASAAAANPRPPRSVLGGLLEHSGPGSLAEVVGGLADGAIIDTRVLMADRLGLDETAWPSAEDRFASDLLLTDAIADPWLAALTRSAACASIPIQLGAHTLVGPGIRVLLGT